MEIFAAQAMSVYSRIFIVSIFAFKLTYQGVGTCSWDTQLLLANYVFRCFPWHPPDIAE